MLITFLFCWSFWTAGFLFCLYRIAKASLDWLDIIRDFAVINMLALPKGRGFVWKQHFVKQVLPAYGCLVLWCLFGLAIMYLGL